MGRMVRGIGGRYDAIGRFADGLEAGDPVAYGVLGFGLLLLASLIAIVIVEVRNKQKAKAKNSRRKPETNPFQR